MLECPDFYLQYSTDWGVEKEDLGKAHDFLHTHHLVKQPSFLFWKRNTAAATKETQTMIHAFFLFCLSKKISEERFRTLFFEATEQVAHVTPPRLLRGSQLPFTCWWLSGSHEIALEAQTTLKELLFAPAAATTIHATPQEISFDQFVKDHPQWEKAWIFWKDHPKVKNKKGVLIQRRQRSGNCYIISPIVWHHYRYQMEIQKEEYGGELALDIRNFILRQLCSEDLSKLICHVGGGSSRAIAKLLLGSNPQLFSVSTEVDLVAHMHQFGPCLVTGFQVDSRFRLSDAVYYSGELVPPITGTHSMVIVGYHKAKEKTWFLLQNWWQKQFIACDWTYIENSGAALLFTRQEHVSIPNFACTTVMEYAEASCDSDDLAPEEYQL
jgi:hypothetical protein